MEENGFPELQKRWTEYKATHKKTIDTSTYDTFNKAILPTVKKYCEENEFVNYHCNITEEDASVIIKSERLIFDEEDSDILRILPLADLVDIQSFDGMVVMTIWVRSWNWNPNKEEIK